MTHALPCVGDGLHVSLARETWPLIQQTHAAGRCGAGLSLVIALTRVRAGQGQTVSPCKRGHAAPPTPCLAGLSLMASLTRDCSPGAGKVPHHARQAMQQLSV